MASRNASTWRLFVAAYPPEDAARRMHEAFLAAANTADAVDLAWPRFRETAACQTHLTLQFVGDRRESETPGVIESVDRAASGIGPIMLRPSRLISLPERGPARLVAMETDAPPALLELHRRLALRLAQNPRQAAEDRFTPHLTLCRFAQPTAGFRIEQRVDLPAFQIDRAVLVRSVLRPAGAEHEPIHAATL